MVWCMLRSGFRRTFMFGRIELRCKIPRMIDHQIPLFNMRVVTVLVQNYFIYFLTITLITYFQTSFSK